ncbi:MAG: chorismate mutase [Bacillota bacterium]|nr:chorismate mutase [Bacillota bacterium]
MTRGVRGATTAESDTPAAIREATQELLRELSRRNGFRPEELAALFFTLTPDLTALYPSKAARELGWIHVPLLDLAQAPGPGSPPLCIRALALWNTRKRPEEIRHVYLRGAAGLRPDLAGDGEGEAGSPWSS